jgi:hypothetical protein
MANLLEAATPVSGQSFQDRMKKLLQQQGRFPKGTKLPPKTGEGKLGSPQPLAGKQAPTRRTGGQGSAARNLLSTGRLPMGRMRSLGAQRRRGQL